MLFKASIYVNVKIIRSLLKNSILIILLIACSGENNTSLPDVITINPENESTLRGSTPISIQFSKSMSPASLNLSGDLAEQSNGGIWSSTKVADDTLTLTPTMTWKHNTGQTINIQASDDAGNPLTQQLNLIFNINNTITRVCVHNNGTEGNGGSADSSL